MGGFWGFFGAIAGAIVGAIVAIPLAPAAIVGGVVGVALCLTGVICPTGNNNGGGKGNGGHVVTINQPPGNTNGSNSSGSNSGNSGGGGSGGGAQTSCSTATTNACGMRGQGFIVGGVCNATVPPNSACPIPVIGSTGFYAEPSLVRSGEQTTLRWNVTNATACSLSGGALNLLGLGIMGNSLSGSVTQKTTYTLTCVNGVGGPSASSNATVNLVPAFQEV